MKLVLATNNINKVREFKEILSPLGFEVVSQSDAGIDAEPDENGKTFEENAFIKAKAVYDLAKTCVIADDSGLVVDALDGRPGVFSARYAEEGKHCDKMLEEMKDVPDDNRTARFVCAICFVDEKGEKLTVEGVCEGKIGFEKKGENGFGYDPIFVYGNKTLAQMTADEKNSISHRAKAIEKLVCLLKDRKEI